MGQKAKEDNETMVPSPEQNPDQGLGAGGLFAR